MVWRGLANNCSAASAGCLPCRRAAPRRATAMGGAAKVGGAKRKSKTVY